LRLRLGDRPEEKGLKESEGGAKKSKKVNDNVRVRVRVRVRVKIRVGVGAKFRVRVQKVRADRGSSS
jgi:hypothetical protein